VSRDPEEVQPVEPDEDVEFGDEPDTDDTEAGADIRDRDGE
jgi:hypothetical protein